MAAATGSRVTTMLASATNHGWVAHWRGRAKAPRHANKVLCMSVQQASKSKVSVAPLHLESAKEPPLNTYKPKEPYMATIVSVERLVGPKAPGETCHIVIDHGGNVPYWEGQSFVYYDPETGKEDPSKNSVCSNFLCNAKPGDKIQLTGPSGKIMLLPEEDPNATHIMIATGTGVAPFRGYLRRMFMEDVPNYRFGGLAWLFLAVANSDSLLYDDEFTNYLKQYPDNFRYDKALSREQKNRSGGKMYVQDKIEEYSDEIFKLLDGGAHIYFCGLKGMMPGIQDTLKKVVEQRVESWEQKLSQLKKKKQWHVELMFPTMLQRAALSNGEERMDWDGQIDVFPLALQRLRASTIGGGPAHRHLHLVDLDLRLQGTAVGTHPSETPIWYEGVEIRAYVKEGVDNGFKLVSAVVA
ncbi:ferredoxin--NADP reductase, root isozyme, chloroplastic-like [Panicum miliaceum]|uniref:ferredoxin--NADP(+) reductase n=1 Tax=Panicum miliaceum TaxID=4540 RepID=A0A3L6TQM2_PANMI|nr:ferredoxin--NADP reductase, root isozyme, chloroplastic-like [Panicum miliaceum]